MRGEIIMLISNKKIAIVRAYEKNYITELETINNILASGYFHGETRDIILRRKRKIILKIRNFRKYVKDIL